MANILVLNGPNLNLLGERADLYGKVTLQEIEERISIRASSLGHQATFFQSNAEHLLIERIQTAKEANFNFIIINPGALAHTSIALRDSLVDAEIPFIEVHISNVYARETFRHHSYLSDIAKGIIVGLGPRGYELALLAVNQDQTASFA